MNRASPSGRRFLLMAFGASALSACGFEPVYGDRTVRAPEAAGASLPPGPGRPAPVQAGASPPVRPTTANIRDEMTAIWIEPIPERAGQLLRNELIDRINGTHEPTQPKYRLEVQLRELKQAVLERRETLETATNLIMIARYKLKTAKGEQIADNQTRTIVLYNQLASPYATIAAEEYARERAIRQMAEDIRLRLALLLANRQGT